MKGLGVEDAGRLMGRVRTRDASAFEQLYDAYHRLVYGIALRMLGDTAAAEDVVQGVFMTVWTRPDAFREGNFAAWLARISRNRCLDALRSRASHPQGEMPADVASDAPMDEEIFARLDGDKVRAALDALPSEQRTPIELGFFGGVTHEEIARRTGTPLGTIKTRIRTGLRKLRTQLESAVSQ